MSVLQEKFKTGKLQGNCGVPKDQCDICNNTTFFQHAMNDTKPNMNFILNLCDDCTAETKKARQQFKKSFNQRQYLQSKGLDEYFK